MTPPCDRMHDPYRRVVDLSGDYFGKVANGQYDLKNPPSGQSYLGGFQMPNFRFERNIRINLGGCFGGGYGGGFGWGCGGDTFFSNISSRRGNNYRSITNVTIGGRYRERSWKTRLVDFGFDALRLLSFGLLDRRAGRKKSNAWNPYSWRRRTHRSFTPTNPAEVTPVVEKKKAKVQPVVKQNPAPAVVRQQNQAQNVVKKDPKVIGKKISDALTGGRANAEIHDQGRKWIGVNKENDPGRVHEGVADKNKETLEKAKTTTLKKQNDDATQCGAPLAFTVVETKNDGKENTGNEFTLIFDHWDETKQCFIYIFYKDLSDLTHDTNTNEHNGETKVNYSADNCTEHNSHTGQQVEVTIDGTTIRCNNISGHPLAHVIK